MNKSIFDFKDYKQYLITRTGGKRSRRGEKVAIATITGCQPTYVTQVLYSETHFSLEQAEKLNSYFHHNKNESEYFLMMVAKARAGTKSLEIFFQEKLDLLLKKRFILKERMGNSSKTLSEVEQSVYYSSWQYSAVHMALTIPQLQKKRALADFFNLATQRLSLILDFLVRHGLATNEGELYKTGETQIRLGNDSANIIKHHSNWRQQAIDSLEREKLNDLHYSGVASISQADLKLIKSKMLDLIKECAEVIKGSKEQELVCINMDFFNMNKKPE